jgi:hypothetical protein
VRWINHIQGHMKSALMKKKNIGNDDWLGRFLFQLAMQ